MENFEKAWCDNRIGKGATRKQDQAPGEVPGGSDGRFKKEGVTSAATSTKERRKCQTFQEEERIISAIASGKGTQTSRRPSSGGCYPSEITCRALLSMLLGPPAAFRERCQRFPGSPQVKARRLGQEEFRLAVSNPSEILSLHIGVPGNHVLQSRRQRTPYRRRICLALLSSWMSSTG